MALMAAWARVVPGLEVMLAQFQVADEIRHVYYQCGLPQRHLFCQWDCPEHACYGFAEPWKLLQRWPRTLSKVKHESSLVKVHRAYAMPHEIALPQSTNVSGFR